MRVLLIAPNFDRMTPGESWSTFKWVEGISALHETVVLTQHLADWNPEKSPTAARKIVNWVEPRIPGVHGRVRWELKPTYPLFYLQARRWLHQARSRGEKFDLVHQINPLALRYPSPARGMGYKYIVGPLAGSLPTPDAFRDELRERHWFRRLRGMDNWRFKHDPWLRGTYREAAALIGVAPYVKDLLAPCGIQRFEVMAETGVERVSPLPRTRAPGPLRLLFVGRLIQTKGILEAIESVSLASQRIQVTFDILGHGDLAPACERLIAERGLQKVVTLHGRLPKEQVFEWYDRSDVFLFPSYREPSGNVVFEAMSRGLPVITSALGGPGYVVTDSCGVRVAAESRTGYVEGLAAAIVRLAGDPARHASMSQAAIDRMTELALWPQKIERMAALYAEVAGTGSPAASHVLPLQSGRT